MSFCLQELKEQLSHLQDELLCRVCMDADIDTAFCPCGHLVCCAACAGRLECCPLCRGAIAQTQRVFLPKIKMAAASVPGDAASTCSVLLTDDDDGDTDADADDHFGSRDDVTDMTSHLEFMTSQPDFTSFSQTEEEVMTIT